MDNEEETKMMQKCFVQEKTAFRSSFRCPRIPPANRRSSTTARGWYMDEVLIGRASKSRASVPSIWPEGPEWNASGQNKAFTIHRESSMRARFHPSHQKPGGRMFILTGRTNKAERQRDLTWRVRTGVCKGASGTLPCCVGQTSKSKGPIRIPKEKSFLRFVKRKNISYPGLTGTLPKRNLTNSPSALGAMWGAKNGCIKTDLIDNRISRTLWRYAVPVKTLGTFKMDICCVAKKQIQDSMFAVSICNPYGPLRVVQFRTLMSKLASEFLRPREPNMHCWAGFQSPVFRRWLCACQQRSTGTPVFLHFCLFTPHRPQISWRLKWILLRVVSMTLNCSLGGRCGCCR